MPDAEERLRTEMNSLWYRWVRVRREISKGWGSLAFEHRAGATVSTGDGVQELPWDAIDVDVTHKSLSTAMTLFLPRYRACVRVALLAWSPTHFEVTWDLVQECLGAGDGMDYVHRECLQIPMEDLEDAVRHAGDKVLHLLRTQLAHDEAWMSDRAAPAAT